MVSPKLYPLSFQDGVLHTIQLKPLDMVFSIPYLLTHLIWCLPHHDFPSRYGIFYTIFSTLSRWCSPHHPPILWIWCPPHHYLPPIQDGVLHTIQPLDIVSSTLYHPPSKYGVCHTISPCHRYLTSVPLTYLPI